MRILLALVLAGSLTGCGTVVNLTFGVEDHEGCGGYGSAFGTSVGGFRFRTKIYGGIRTDIFAFGRGAGGGMRGTAGRPS